MHVWHALMIDVKNHLNRSAITRKGLLKWLLYTVPTTVLLPLLPAEH